GLALEARVTEQIISFDNPNNNSLVFSNYVKLKNTVSATLQKRLAELVEANTPYTIKLARNNSLIFKNGQGETIITPSLYKADKPITADVSWRWALDGVVTVGMQYLVKAKDIDDTAVLTVSGYIGNKEVATTEITLTNVNDGADGRTPYLYIAYANSADGRTDFSTSNTDNKRYLGTYTDYTQADSTDPTKYKWVDMVGSVEVGGVNLLTGTRDWSSNIQRWSSNYNGVWHDETEEYNNLKVKSTTDGWNGWHQNVFVKAGEYYTLSYYAKADTNIKVINSLTWEQSPIFQGSVAKFDGSNSISDNITTEWKRYSRTVKITGDGSLQWRIEYDGMALPNGKWYIAGMKLERGNIATDYSQAPEDVQDDINSKADSALTQEQLNALEAKRLQMETEMKALATLQQVSKLETFINNLKQEDTDGRQKIIETTKTIEERVKDIVPIMEYSQKLQFMDTYITQGNGGMVIGANDSSTKLVVTPDRISFQSGGSEVAYISQRMLHIDNGVFTLSLQLGHYITRAHPKNEYINATYFVK
ncbi:hypothetical protein OQG70_04310, partial [Streptococcus macedonicus]|nr:hypothetical protein [Streptococcus macedonicus]